MIGVKITLVVLVIPVCGVVMKKLPSRSTGLMECLTCWGGEP